MTPQKTDVSSIARLADITRNSNCRIIALSGGHMFRSKLHQMGIFESQTVRVIINGGHGPLVVESGGTRMIIGREMAARIQVWRNI